MTSVDTDGVPHVGALTVGAAAFTAVVIAELVAAALLVVASVHACTTVKVYDTPLVRDVAVHETALSVLSFASSHPVGTAPAVPPLPNAMFHDAKVQPFGAPATHESMTVDTEGVPSAGALNAAGAALLAVRTTTEAHVAQRVPE
jgi:hypothetical protein